MMASMSKIFLTALLTGLLVGGCGWLLAPDPVLGSVVNVDAPDTVGVGQSFTVTVTTTGPNGCWRKDHTEVSVDGLEATITPYDFDEREADPHRACHNAVVYPEHIVELRFDAAGTAVLRVLGREGTGRDVTVVVE
jgi:hypothetical protein